MPTLKLGIIKEGKTPPDKRVPLTPAQCKIIEKSFDVEVYVQSSDVRAFNDETYASLGVKVVKDISHCHVLMGVKEVQISDLISDKIYFFFSHTIKKQPYNRELLKQVLSKKICLIDYECITNERKIRLIGFGRYAGIVGCYNGFLTLGLKTKSYDLKPAHQCDDRVEMENELKKVSLNKNTKILLTGSGRVGKGAIEIIQKLGLKEVSPQEYLEQEFNEPVYTQLNVQDMYAHPEHNQFNKSDFYHNPEGYQSLVPKYVALSDMYVPCHYWDSRGPFVLSREDLKEVGKRLQVVADISCDIDGPIGSTLRASTIAKPIYGYHPEKESEVDFMNQNAIAVMAVDNLPCELPKDASEDFGNELIKNVLPSLFNNDNSEILKRASITNSGGSLTEDYNYLKDYVG